MAVISGTFETPTVSRIHDEPIVRNAGAVGVISFIAESDVSATSPCFKVISPTVNGWPARVSAWPVTGFAPTANFTLTLLDEHGSTWTVTINKDGDDNFLANPYPPVMSGPLTISADNFGAGSKRMEIAIFFTEAEPGVNYSAAIFDTLSPMTTAGDIIYRNATTATRLGIGTTGQRLRTNSGATAPAWATDKENVVLRDSLVACTFPRELVGTGFGTPTSGTLNLVRVGLRQGQAITNIVLVTGSTAATLPTNWWFALYDSSLALLRQTADQLTAAVAANTVHTLALSSAYTPTSDVAAYFGFMFAATATPTIHRVSTVSGTTTINGMSPTLCGTSTTGLTTTAPDPAAAITAVAQMFWIGAT